MTPEVRTFHWADYLVFGVMLCISAGIGVFFWWRGRRNKPEDSSEEYLLGGRSMGPIPVALSLQASFLSAITILGMPSEAYYFGITFFYVMIGNQICALITAHVFIPVIHNLHITSGYEYFELRFNRAIRSMASLAFILMTIMFMGVALFAPALAFSQVTGLSLLVSILGTGIVCTFYTAMGGIKAVVWTDSFQMIIILVGIITLSIKGSLDAGGITHTWRRAQEGGRLNLNSFSFDPRTRTTFWTQMVGGPFLMMTMSVANQTFLQRYLCVKDVKSAQLASYLSNTLLMPLYFTILMAVGIAMYGFYEGCDPLLRGNIASGDQMVAIFMMDILGDLYGLPGLFTACVFSAALSTVSSGINALSAVMIVDIVGPLHKFVQGRELTPRAFSWLSLILVVVFGVITVVMSFAAEYMGQAVVQLAISATGMVGGPILGLFFLAFFVPWINSKGAGVGLVAGLVFAFWIGIGGILNQSRPPMLPLSVNQCPAASMNVTMLPDTTTTAATYTTSLMTTTPPSSLALQPLYDVSYLWYTMYAMLVTMVTAPVVSLFTGCNKDRPVRPELLAPCIRRWYPAQADDKPYAGDKEGVSIIPVDHGPRITYINQALDDKEVTQF